MKKYNHNYGVYELEKNHPAVASKIENNLRNFCNKETSKLKGDVETLFSDWDHKGVLTDNLNLRYEYRKDGIQVETQFGNVARYYADIMKIEKAYREGIIDYGVMILPDKERANSMGTNIAYYERTEKELKEMRDIISCPIVLYGV